MSKDAFGPEEFFPGLLFGLLASLSAGLAALFLTLTGVLLRITGEFLR